MDVSTSENHPIIRGKCMIFIFDDTAKFIESTFFFAFLNENIYNAQTLSIIHYIVMGAALNAVYLLNQYVLKRVVGVQVLGRE